jgi:hypothetical protein
VQNNYNYLTSINKNEIIALCQSLLNKTFNNRHAFYGKGDASSLIAGIISDYA